MTYKVAILLFVVMYEPSLGLLIQTLMLLKCKSERNIIMIMIMIMIMIFINTILN